ncbi:hypothetical protein QJS10_CPB18g00235 [Acorus calamus]|uniref:Uncharacterized protein n=1 Tax=Acorus calamus TaxID=4465 RepID=A0AAV9CLT6_ACOCL|nr:hypothetical protein QJS10_CPB18g00235 [Acorus calamus]
MSSTTSDDGEAPATAAEDAPPEAQTTQMKRYKCRKIAIRVPPPGPLFALDPTIHRGEVGSENKPPNHSLSLC